MKGKHNRASQLQLSLSVSNFPECMVPGKQQSQKLKIYKLTRLWTIQSFVTYLRKTMCYQHIIYLKLCFSYPYIKFFEILKKLYQIFSSYALLYSYLFSITRKHCILSKRHIRCLIKIVIFIHYRYKKLNLSFDFVCFNGKHHI